MKKIVRYCSILLLSIMLVTGNLFAQKTTIEAIKSNPRSFDKEVVQVSGLVTNYVPASSNSTAYYLIKGDYGETIRVNTPSGSPTTNEKYCIKGILYVEYVKNRPVNMFISEQKRESGICTEIPQASFTPKDELNFGKVRLNNSYQLTINASNSGTGELVISDISLSNEDIFKLVGPKTIVVPPHGSKDISIVFTPKQASNYKGILTISHNSGEAAVINLVGDGKFVFIEWLKNNWVFVAIILGILLLAYLIATLLKRNKRQKEEEQITAPPAISPSQFVAQPSPAPASEFTTIRIQQSSPKTLKYIPGEFEIISGADAGKSFKIAAYPGAEGNIVTLGREEITGERAYAHIQLHEKTVSRKQAEILSDNGKLIIKNLSTTNYTMVDGKELLPGVTAELKPNTVFKVGEVEIRYKN